MFYSIFIFFSLTVEPKRAAISRDASTQEADVEPTTDPSTTPSTAPAPTPPQTPPLVRSENSSPAPSPESQGSGKFLFEDTHVFPVLRFYSKVQQCLRVEASQDGILPKTFSSFFHVA